MNSEILQARKKKLNSRFTQDEFLHPDVLDLLHYVKEKSIDKAALGIPYRTHGVDVFSFPIFSLEFCNRLVSEIDHLNETSMPKGRPNSMNNYGVGEISTQINYFNNIDLLVIRSFLMNWA